MILIIYFFLRNENIFEIVDLFIYNISELLLFVEMSRAYADI